MRKDKLVLPDLDAHASPPELIGHILRVLNEFPNPPDLGALHLREVVEVLGQLLRQLLEAGLVFRFLVFPNCLTPRLHNWIL